MTCPGLPPSRPSNECEQITREEQVSGSRGRAGPPHQYCHYHRAHITAVWRHLGTLHHNHTLLHTPPDVIALNT
ncbi:hypothetical protein E2C01_012975 [Portunus trituberculatus]|uniref:Uncharacterized protein n=1 Tax=Portunus trituberculatus TaxID=210409 RepID=A0A5B7DG43_PORTR|nr:hypothetical protein [Portunus trituberculatus]